MTADRRAHLVRVIEGLGSLAELEGFRSALTEDEARDDEVRWALLGRQKVLAGKQGLRR